MTFHKVDNGNETSEKWTQKLTKNNVFIKNNRFSQARPADRKSSLFSFYFGIMLFLCHFDGLSIFEWVSKIQKYCMSRAFNSGVFFISSRNRKTGIFSNQFPPEPEISGKCNTAGNCRKKCRKLPENYRKTAANSLEKYKKVPEEIKNTPELKALSTIS